MSAGCGGGVAKAKMGDAPYDAQQGFYQKTVNTLYRAYFFILSLFRLYCSYNKTHTF